MDKKQHIPPFGIPEDYFSNFEERLFLKIEEEKFPKSSGFRVPPAYFTNLEEVIIAKLQPKKEAKVIPLASHKILVFASAIAACLVIAVSLFKFSNFQSEPNIETVNLSLIDQYIDDGNLDMDLYEVTNYLKNLDNLDLSLESLLISDEEIETYLYESLEDDFWIYGSID